MLQKGIVRESVSPWSSPVVLKKKDGGFRFCVDLRRVNAVTGKDSFPIIDSASPVSITYWTREVLSS